MGIRSLLQLSLASLVLSLAPSALADVPSPTTGSGGSTTTTAGTGGSPYDPDCTVAQESIAGKTCQPCDPASSCKTLSSDYHLVCQSSASVAIYCNGPDGTVYQDQNVACSVTHAGQLGGHLRSPGAWSSVAGGLAIAVAGILARRRRRR